MNKLGSLPFLEKKILLTYSAKFQAQAVKKVFMGRQLFWLGGMLGSVLRLPRTLQTGEQRFLFFAVIKSRYFPKSWVLKKHSQYQKCHSVTIGAYMWISRFLKRVTVTSSPVFWFLKAILSAFCIVPNHTTGVSNLLSGMVMLYHGVILFSGLSQFRAPFYRDGALNRDTTVLIRL